MSKLTTKADVMAWMCKDCPNMTDKCYIDNRCKPYRELSALLDRLIEGVPCDLVTCSGVYVCNHMQSRVAGWGSKGKGRGNET